MLKGKVAVITGGTRGIGYATVKKFLENGATVVLFGSRQETVDKALTSLKEENPDWPVPGAWPDLGNADAVAEEIGKIKETYGKIDILINNAGLQVNLGNMQRGQVVALYNYMAQMIVELIKLASLIITLNKSAHVQTVLPIFSK